MGAHRRAERQSKGVSTGCRVANPSQALATTSACGVKCPSGEFYCCNQQVLGPGGQWDTGQPRDTQQRGPMASVVSAMTQPPHPWGFACGGPAPAPTWAVAALWQCHRQGGDARLSQQLGWLSEARSSSSSFLLPDRLLKFKAGLLQAQRSKNATNRGERGCGHSYAKTIPLGSAPWSKPSLFGGQLQLPISAGCSQSSAAPALSPGRGGWSRCVCCDPFAPARH